MDTFGSIHACLAHHGKELSCAELAHGDVPAQIARVLKDCGHARPQRRCPLRPDVVLWLVLAMVLHRGLSIPNVFAHLLASWRRCRLPSLLRPVSDGALAHARERLGVKPLQRLFEVLASQVHPPATFHGRRVWAIDGSRVDLPDTPANVKWFGRPSGSHQSGYPQVHLLTLQALYSREIGAATWLRVPPSERKGIKILLEALQPGDLVLLDRGFYAAWVIEELIKRGVEFVMRMPHGVRVVTEKVRGPGDFDVCVKRRGRRDRIGAAKRRVAVRARVVRCAVNGRPLRLVTNLMDAEVGALEFVELYHTRWEIETAYREMKVDLITLPRGAAPTLFRGRSPEMVLQELWATMAVYTLVRRQMARAAEHAGIEPTKLSFTDCVELLKTTAAIAAALPVAQLPAFYDDLLVSLGRCRLDRPLRSRRMARVVKRRTKHFPPKRRQHRCRVVKAEPRVELRMTANPRR